MTKNRRRLKTVLSGGAVLAVACASVLAGVPAVAADASLSVTLTQETGKAPFDADAAAGHDPGPGDEIIRTNDTITYTLGVRFEGQDQTTPTLTFTLPRGQELVSTPPYCLPGSSVTPATLPVPAVPLTSMSWLSLPTQTITCVVANQPQGTALNYAFEAKVRPEVPNGTHMEPMSFSATTDQVTTSVSSSAVQQTVSAAARYDLSKRSNADTTNTGPLYQDTHPCTWDNSRACQVILYPLTITAPTAGKGISPLASPITITDDISPDAFFGAGTTSSAAWQSASNPIDKYGVRLLYCDMRALGNQIPGQAVANGSTIVNSVRDSGTINCTQPGGPGTPVHVTITNADTSAYTFPSTSSNGDTTLDANLAYVISTNFAVEYPTDALVDLGIRSGNTWTMNWTNTYSDFAATDLSGAPNIEPTEANNTRTGSTQVRTGEGYDKFFMGVYGDPQNTSGSTYSTNIFDGPPGSSKVHDGNTVALPGQTVMSALNYIAYKPPGSGTTFSKSVVLCDAWDESAFALKPGTYRGFLDRLSSGGDAAFVWAWYYGGNYQSSTTGIQNLRIEYASGPAGSGSNSTCQDGTWYTDPASVPGATLGADGTFTGVNRVRVSFSDQAYATTDLFFLTFNIALQIRQGHAVGDVLPNWASGKTLSGVHTTEEILASASNWNASTYDPAANTGAMGDRLILGTARARISKEVRNPSTGEFTSTAVPQYTSGSNVDYRLTPTLTADVPAGTFTPVTVEDCLPEYQQFVSATRSDGSPVTPTLIQAGAPAGSQLVCAQSQTYIKWELGPQQVGKSIDPIIYTVSLLDTIRNGVYTNTALVSANGDVSATSLRRDDVQISVVVPTGIRIAKSTPQSIVEINPAGVDQPRTLTWTVDFANIDSPANVSNVDVIDVLPANAVGASTFHGTLSLTSADVTAGTNIQLLYTKTPTQALSVDPVNATNTANGSTVWCDAVTGGTVISGAGTGADCPTGLETVTGLRMIRPGDFTPDDSFRVKVVMTPSGNNGGDIYDNVTSGRADGVSQQVGPASRRIQIIESSIGDFVWEDSNHDGIQNDGEPAVPGFPVLLSGSDLNGNLITRSTTTDAAGKYMFAGLPSGAYRITFDPQGLGSTSTFTTQSQGTDDTIDSDGDPTTGQTREIQLPQATAITSVDQGIFIDRNIAISVDKRLVDQSPLNAQNHGTVTYELTVHNSGTATGTYDLDDELRFGGSITIDRVTASTTGPGAISTQFDGQQHTQLVTHESIGGGQTHVYRVEVAATVNTSISEAQRDCTLAEGENGTGYLNDAILTVNGDTSRDAACGIPPVPTRPPGLATTGGVLSWAPIAGGLLLLVAGSMTFLISRARRSAREYRTMP